MIIQSPFKDFVCYIIFPYDCGEIPSNFFRGHIPSTNHYLARHIINPPRWYLIKSFIITRNEEKGICCYTTIDIVRFLEKPFI